MKYITKTTTVKLEHSDSCSMLNDIRKFVDDGYKVVKIWYEPQNGPTDSYYNARLEKNENE